MQCYLLQKQENVQDFVHIFRSSVQHFTFQKIHNII